MAKRSSILNTR